MSCRVIFGGSAPNSLFKTNKKKQSKMYRLSESERKELLELTRENNKMLKSILTIVASEHSSDFMNNIVANIIGNGIMPGKR